jgi:hypothetical protein
LEDWLFSVDTYFTALGDHVPDHRRIAFTSGLFTGDARKWFRTQQNVLLQPGVTFDAFKNALRTAFLPVNAVKAARDRLDEIRQTGSVEGYNGAFRSLMLEIPTMDAETVLHRYIKGLKPHVQEQIQIQDPATLDEAMHAADRVDRARASGRNGRGNTSNRRPFYAARSQGPVPMELGAVQARPGFRPQQQQQGVKTRLTPEERAYLIANNGCVYCRRLGHTLSQCRARPSNPANAATPSLQSGKGYRRRA